MPGTAGSASRYSTLARSSGGGSGATCGVAADVAEADVGAGSLSVEAPCSSLEHPQRPSAATIVAALRTAVGCRPIRARSVARRTHRLDQRHRRVMRQLPAALID